MRQTKENSEYVYTYPHGERVTPEKEIPPLHRITAILPNKQTQIVDDRLCYTFHPEYADSQYPDGALLECINLALDKHSI